MVYSRGLGVDDPTPQASFAQPTGTNNKRSVQSFYNTTSGYWQPSHQQTPGLNYNGFSTVAGLIAEVMHSMCEVF
jgi:hypothetical protein